MAENSKIEWTDHTFNPWEGCQKVGPGCDNCYAEARNSRFGGGQAINWGPGAPRRRTSRANWNLPYAWNGRAKGQRIRYRVFCASLADVFDNEVPAQWRIELMQLILSTPHLDWMLLTKRIGNAADMLESAFLAAHAGRERWKDNVPANVWIGATVVNQAEADRDIPKLLAVPAARRFLSIEPMLGPIDLTVYSDWLGRSPGGLWCPDCPERGVGIDPSEHQLCLGEIMDSPSWEGIDWVICGGESGPHARPMHPDWARSLRDQCVAAGVPFLFKQWGEHDLSYDRDRDDPDQRRCGEIGRLPGRWVNLAGGHGFNGMRVHYAHKVGKARAGRLLDGRAWDEVPNSVAA